MVPIGIDHFFYRLIRHFFYFIDKQFGGFTRFGYSAPMFFDTDDYRQVIKNEYERRSQTHRSYSLRAFARDLKIGPTHLNEVLSGKKGLSRVTAAQIASKLGLSEAEIDSFCDLVDSKHARAKVKREAASLRVKNAAHGTPIHTLRIDAFHLISDWYHFAILQLIDVKGFRNDSTWIADRLGIFPSQAATALERLKRMDLVIEKAGRLRSVKAFVSTPDVSSVAIRENHRQIRAKALLALESQTIDERDFSSVQMPINSGDFSRAKKRLRDFRRNFYSN